MLPRESNTPQIAYAHETSVSLRFGQHICCNRPPPNQNNGVTIVVVTFGVVSCMARGGIGLSNNIIYFTDHQEPSLHYKIFCPVSMGYRRIDSLPNICHLLLILFCHYFALAFHHVILVLVLVVSLLSLLVSKGSGPPAEHIISAPY